MSWLVEAKPGDRFRWVNSNVICRIVKADPTDIRIEFVYENGPHKGQWGYTEMPQGVELVNILDDLANI